MIEWSLMGASFLWILGLALLLATFSWGRYRMQAGTSRRTAGTALAYRLGLGLFALGMWLSSESWWQQVGWIVVTALLGLEALFGLQRRPRRRRARP